MTWKVSLFFRKLLKLKIGDDISLVSNISTSSHWIFKNLATQKISVTRLKFDYLLNNGKSTLCKVGGLADFMFGWTKYFFCKDSYILYSCLRSNITRKLPDSFHSISTSNGRLFQHLRLQYRIYSAQLLKIWWWLTWCPVHFQIYTCYFQNHKYFLPKLFTYIVGIVGTINKKRVCNKTIPNKRKDSLKKFANFDQPFQ